MKIGILTHPLDYNYGCLLQNFALQTTLRRLGHDAITINRYSAPPSFYILLKSWISRVILKILGRKNVSLAWNQHVDCSTLDYLSKETNKFVKKNIKCTERIYPDKLKAIDKQYLFDAYVVGSDQVWLPHYSKDAFLSFVKRKNVKKVFYAASAGSSNFSIDPKLVKKCKKLVRDFAGVSVREDTLLSVAKEYLGINAQLALDPTLLLEMNDYLDVCDNEPANTPSIFVYILDKSLTKKEVIEKVKSDLNIPVSNGTVDVDYVKGCNAELDDYVYPSVDSWIWKLAKSNFVVTDSFHGTCMSIVFRKPFVVIGNPERGLDRFKSLLKMFDMEKRMITNVSEFNNKLYEGLGDNVERVLKEEKNDSLRFLKDSLEK